MIKQYYTSSQLIKPNEFEVQTYRNFVAGVHMIDTNMIATHRAISYNHYLYECHLKIGKELSTVALTLNKYEIRSILNRMHIPSNHLNWIHLDNHTDISLLSTLGCNPHELSKALVSLGYDAINPGNNSVGLGLILLNPNAIEVEKVSLFKGKMIDKIYTPSITGYKHNHILKPNQVWLANLDQYGLKKRPAIILQENLRGDRLTIVPFSSTNTRFQDNNPRTQKAKFPEHIYIKEIDSIALCDTLINCKTDVIEAKWKFDDIELSEKSMDLIRDKVKEVQNLGFNKSFTIGDTIIYYDKEKAVEVIGVISERYGHNQNANYLIHDLRDNDNPYFIRSMKEIEPTLKLQTSMSLNDVKKIIESIPSSMDVLLAVSGGGMKV